MKQLKNWKQSSKENLVIWKTAELSTSSHYEKNKVLPANPILEIYFIYFFLRQDLWLSRNSLCKPEMHLPMPPEYLD